MHLAFLQLTDLAAKVVMKEIPLLERSSVGKPVMPGVDRYRATLPPLTEDTEWIYLNPSVQAARFVMRIPYAGPGRDSGRSMPGFEYYNGEMETHKPAGKPLGPAHHVGPMEEFESLIENGRFGRRLLGEKTRVYRLLWSNGGGIEYANPLDEPVPDVPISGTVLIYKYSVEFKSGRNNLYVTNKLAGIKGRVEFYTAESHSSHIIGAGSHAEAQLERRMPDHLAQWRIRISSTSLDKRDADVFLFNCTGKNGCQFVNQQPVADGGALLTVDQPQEGDWRVVVRAHDNVARSIS